MQNQFRGIPLLNDIKRMLVIATFRKKKKGEQTCPAILDTGAGCNVITPLQLDGLDYKRGSRRCTLTSAAGNKNVGEEIIIASLSVGPLSFRNVEFFVVDYGKKQYCTLGMEFFRRAELCVKTSESAVWLRELSPSEQRTPLWTQKQLDVLELSIGFKGDEITAEGQSTHITKKDNIALIQKAFKDGILSGEKCMEMIDWVSKQ